MRIPKNSVEIILFVSIVIVGYYYEGLSGAFLDSLAAILLIIRTKLREKVKW